MKVSHIHIQNTLLMLNNKKTQQEVQRQLQARCNGMVNQVSIFNSHFNNHILPVFKQEVHSLIIRKCKIVLQQPIEIFGVNLKSVQLPHCHLKQLPIIHSQHLQKLNVANNQIQQVQSIQNKQLKVLDLRNNKIVKIARQIFIPGLTIMHEFISIKQEKGLLSLPMCLYPHIIQISQLIQDSIKTWSKSDLIQTCEVIIQNNNQTLLKQILPYLTQDFIEKIFQIAKIKKKHSIIELLITTREMVLSDEEAIILLMPAFISKSTLYRTNLNNMIKVLATYCHERQRVICFLDHLKSLQQGKNLFIQSQKDLINFMSYNADFPNHYESDFILTQITFFQDYDFSNKTILHYLIQLDNLKLLNHLLTISLFRQRLFSTGLFKKLLKPNKKIMKVLLKEEKVYKKQLRYKNELFFPQYKERKSFCLKNDVYDYQILSEYQQMQCSYTHKDLRFTLKFCNKQNEISIAKRIQTQLKRNNLKTMQNKRSNYSTNSSILQA